MFNPAWETIHRDRQWGRWPDINFVRFAMRHYGGAPDRSQVGFLELGCGTGAQLAFLLEEGFAAVGVDGSATAIQRAFSLLERRGIFERKERGGVFQGELRNSDLARLSVGAHSLDCILDICTLQHLPDPVAAATIAKARGWLKPGGRFFSVMLRDAVGYAFPAPAYPRTKTQVENLFPGFDVAIGKQVEDRTDGVTISHWIIEAQVTT